jgi:hypothetical protein
MRVAHVKTNIYISVSETLEPFGTLSHAVLETTWSSIPEVCHHAYCSAQCGSVYAGIPYRKIICFLNFTPALMNI